LDRSFFHFVRDHACVRQTDRRTDRQTEFSSLDRVCISCGVVKKYRTEPKYKLRPDYRQNAERLYFTHKVTIYQNLEVGLLPRRNYATFYLYRPNSFFIFFEGKAP